MMVTRALAGFVLASAIAIGGRLARSLSTGGAIAAVAVGTVGTIAGWNWAAVLILFFVTSSALSRFRRVAREARIASIVEKGDERDAWQVLANGGVFGLAALGLASAPAAALDWGALAFGALAAATSDTWATEIGTLAGRPPRSIVSLKALPPGTSGGVTMPGLAASVVGALFIGLAAYATGASNDPGAIIAGGVAGSLADSLVGATLQERRWCDRCAQSTERRVHSCGQRTRIVGGVPGARNDVVNVICTIVGGVVAVLVAR
jgi:uncharacterized protein (TIGR00297 family)